MEVNYMLQEIINITNTYTKSHDKMSRKYKGQFFTPLSIALSMAKYTAMKTNTMTILEPGAGNGILSAALIFHCINNNLCHSFCIDFVENDPDVIPTLKKTAQMIERYVADHNGTININIYAVNFLTEPIKSSYDVVICNPPYKKIRKDSDEARYLKKYVHGQPNLYALFMCKALDCLRRGGKFAFITPRSWTSGSYYKAARKHILMNLNISDLILFESRNNVFESEDVLQETLITIGCKDTLQNKTVNVYYSNGSLQDLYLTEAPASTIKCVGKDNYLLLPISEHDLEIVQNMASKTDTFESLGYCFKTGPVVEFRNKKAISNEPKDGFVPMYRSANIVNGTFVFPVSTPKPQYIDATKEKLLLPDTNTVLLKRLSSKEEKRRLQSCVYYGKNNNKNSYISIENHVNYVIHTDGSPLIDEEAEWIQQILASDEYDTYYRLINGSTQVNATELNQLPLDRRIH